MYVLKQTENLEKNAIFLLLLLSDRLDSAHLGSQLGEVFKSKMVYTSTTLFTYYGCLYLQKNADIPNRFCVRLTPITFLFPVAPRHSWSWGINDCRLKN